MTAGGEQAPDERALLPNPVLDVVAAARPLTRRRDMYVVEHSIGGEPLDLVAVDVVEAGRADAIEERRFGQRDARALHRQTFGEEGTHGGEAGPSADDDHRIRRVVLQVESVGAVVEDVDAVALAERVQVAGAHPAEITAGRTWHGHSLEADGQVRDAVTVDPRARASRVVVRPERLCHSQELEDVQRAGREIVEQP